MSITHIVRQAARLVLLPARAGRPGSCGAIGGILGCLPANLFSAICP